MPIPVNVQVGEAAPRLARSPVGEQGREVNDANEWGAPLETWLNGYASWPAQPGPWQLQAVLMAAPLNMRPGDFCHQLSIGLAVGLLANQSVTQR